MRSRPGWLIGCALAVTALAAQAGTGGPPRTRITVWAAQPPAEQELYGGLAYGGFAPTSGAMITEQRDVEIAGGEARLSGIAATIDPGSVQLRDLTDGGALVTEQRVLAGATTPSEILARHVGDPITVTTPKGEVTGTLISVDDQVIAVEVGAGDQRHLQMMQRNGYVQNVRMPAGTVSDKSSLVWRVRTTKPGKHTIELSYRADGMSWAANYLAVLDEAGRAIDFSARATIKNATGTNYDGAELTLVSGGVPAMPAMPSGGPLRPSPPAHFGVPAQVRIGHGEAVQVELIPPRTAAKARSVITYEAMSDPSANFQAFPGLDCSQFNGSEGGAGRAEVELELELPAQTVLPDGKVQLFHRRAGRVEFVTEEPLHARAGLARIRISPASDITGERHATTCNYDETAHTIQETVEIAIESKAKQATDIIVREFLWRWPVWHLETEDHKGVRAGPQIQEYRVRVPANGKQVVTYTAVYTW